MFHTVSEHIFEEDQKRTVVTKEQTKKEILQRRGRSQPIFRSQSSWLSPFRGKETKKRNEERREERQKYRKKIKKDNKENELKVDSNYLNPDVDLEHFLPDKGFSLAFLFIGSFSTVLEGYPLVNIQHSSDVCV